jgi:hypothetical protein
MQLPTFWAFCGFRERLSAAVVFQQQIGGLCRRHSLSRRSFSGSICRRASADAESEFMLSDGAGRFAGPSWFALGVCKRRGEPRETAGLFGQKAKAAACAAALQTFPRTGSTRLTSSLAHDLVRKTGTRFFRTMR